MRRLIPLLNVTCVGLAAVLFTSILGAQTPTADTQRLRQSVHGWIRLRSGTPASLRGVSAVNGSVIWGSGTGGTYLWTDDGGAQWHVGTVPGAASLDFRDVHAVSLDTAYLMVAGQDTARIYKTTDRGAHWRLQYDDTRKGVFLDAIAFFDATHGLALGDPMDGHFFLLRTDDGGAHWTPVAPDATPAALPGEAAFAASGTALVTSGAHDAWFATGGGRVARVFRTHDGGTSWQVSETPVTAGTQGAGIFSLAFLDPRRGIAVGGNYATPDTAATTVALTTDGGVTWTAVPPSGVTGYLSGVTYLPASHGEQLIAVGPQGAVRSEDGGRTWGVLHTAPSTMSQSAREPALNAVTAPRADVGVWAVGERGAIRVLR